MVSMEMKEMVSTYAEYEAWIIKNKEKVLEYIARNDIFLRDVMSARTYNIMRINSLQKMSDIIFLYSDELSKLDMIDKNVLDEVLMFKRNYLRKCKRSVIAYVSGEDTTKEPSIRVIENRNVGTKKNENALTDKEECISSVDLKCAQELLYDDFSMMQIRNFLGNKNVEISNLNLSVRTYQALRRTGIQFLHEAVRFYPDKFEDIRNFGRKSIEEICNSIECYIAHNISEFRVYIDNEDIKIMEDNPYTLSVKQLLEHPVFREKTMEFLQVNTILVEDMMLSNRAINVLKNNGHSTFLDVLRLYPDKIQTLPKIGTKTVEDIKERTEFYMSQLQNSVSAYCDGDVTAICSDDFVCETIQNCFADIGFKGLSFKEIYSAFPEIVDESRVKKCIGGMIADKKLEYVDYRLYKVYPSVFDVISESLMQPEHKEILCKRIKGISLEEIGTQMSLTRERIRQIYSKALDKLREECVGKHGSRLFDEDYYTYLYSSYEVTKELWLDYLGVSDITFGYLNHTLSKGSKPIDEALNDPQIDLILKFKIQDFLNRNKILIDGLLIEKQRRNLEDYALLKLCKKEKSYDVFVEQYNEMLKDNGIEFDESIYYTEEVRRTRSNRLTESMLCLWKHGERLRYYDIESYDYTELLETLNLSQFSNIEISTLKFFEDFPDLMEKYDIGDQYELHNLLKKVVDVKDYSDMSFKRQPVIRFGEFDRDQAMYDILEAVSPVSADELAEYVHMEYGYDKATVLMNYLKSLNQYYHHGMYTIDFKHIPDDRVELFKDALVDDFYYIAEIKKIYKEMFNDADIEDINPLSLKSLGFSVLGNYVVQNYETAESYFKYLLTKDDVCDISIYNKKFASLQTYYDTSRQMRLNYDILLFEPNKVITLNRLSKLGITKGDIRAFCDDVESFVSNNCYFTMHSLKNIGFTSNLDDLGFDDYFYEMLLAADPRYLWQRAYGKIVLHLKSNTLKNSISIKSFLISVLSEYESVDIDEFIGDCSEKYGIKIPNRYEVIDAISNTDFYYDRIMDKIYRNKNVYYEEFDD